MNHRQRLAFAILGLALAGPTFAAKRNLNIAGPSLVARYDMDVNVACDPSATQVNRGFVEQQCTYFFPLTHPGLQGKFLSLSLFARDDNNVYDIEARLVRKRYFDTEDAFDDPDTVIKVETEDADNDLRQFDGVPPASLQKIDTNLYFYYVEVIIPDVNLGVIGLQVRYDDKAK